MLPPFKILRRHCCRLFWKEEIMKKYNNLIAEIQHIRGVKDIHSSINNKKYYYLCPIALNIEIGDYVVIDAHKGKSFSIGKVINLVYSKEAVNYDGYVNAFIICKIPLEPSKFIYNCDLIKKWTNAINLAKPKRLIFKLTVAKVRFYKGSKNQIANNSPTHYVYIPFRKINKNVPILVSIKNGHNFKIGIIEELSPNIPTKDTINNFAVCKFLTSIPEFSSKLKLIKSQKYKLYSRMSKITKDN